MCYYLYGALYGDIDTEEYAKIQDKYDFRFKPGTKHDLKMCAAGERYTHRVTDWICDCDSPIGSKDAQHPELTELEALFGELKGLAGAKCVYLSRTWEGQRNKKEIEVRLSDIDIKQYLANLEANCIYTFKL